MDGNYGSSLPLRLRYCDAVIYFDLPRPVCMTGILSRSVKNRGQTRPDMGEGCPERINVEFVLYTWRFKNTEGRRLKDLLCDCGKPVVRLRSRREAERYLEAYNHARA